VQLLNAGAEHWVGRLPAHVVLADCRGAHGPAAADWIVAVLLAVYRELPGFVRAQDARRWDKHITDEPTGKRVLLVGAGDLAENTVRRLAPFDVATTLVGRRARPGVHGVEEGRDLLPPGHPLWDAPGLLLPPHVCGAVPGAVRRAFTVAAEQVAAFVRGEEPPNQVRDGY